LLEWRTQVNNQLHALSVSPVVVTSVRERLVELIDTVNQHIAQMDAELLELVKIEPEPPPDGEIQHAISEAEQIEQQWKAAIALLLSIPGIGLLTSCWLVVATLNFSTCETAEAATHYLGLAPIMRSSGTSVRGHAQIGHSGHARARAHLYLATLAAARFNPVIKRYYDHLRKAGKPMKVARCACARKLLHIAFAVVKSEQAFDPNYHTATQMQATST
jgi:transposase